MPDSTTMRTKVLESNTVQETGGSTFGIQWVPPQPDSYWTINISERKLMAGGYVANHDFVVWAEHQSTGAKIENEDSYKTKAKARERAAELATTCRGIMEKFQWKQT